MIATITGQCITLKRRGVVIAPVALHAFHAPGVEYTFA